MISSDVERSHKRRKIKSDKFSSTLENLCFPQCLHLLAATISPISEIGRVINWKFMKIVPWLKMDSCLAKSGQIEVVLL